jgi:hypothetical protein
VLDTLVTEHAGASPESSVAETEIATGTICLFGGVMVEGEADTLAITGAVVSGGTTTLTDDQLALLAPSTHTSLNV